MIRLHALTISVWVGLSPSYVRAEPPAPPPRADYEVQARGPVHEAFAAPVDGLLTPTQPVPQAPPPPLDEQVPAVRPAGDYEWVGGYWFWNDDTSEYVWVSGCWRNPPPGREWLAGEWVKAGDSFRWVSGQWRPKGQDKVRFLPPPPAILEEKAGAPADATSMFVPGTWVWVKDKYEWRPGRWVTAPDGWVWQPDQSVWTPAGYLFVDGYWDYPLEERGLLFAPVLPPQKPKPFTPQYVVRPAFLAQALFVRAAIKHYVFGDYFEKPNLSEGYVPWMDYRISRTSFDPLFTYYAVHKPSPDWDKQLRELYESRYAARAPRPPRTLALQQPGTTREPTEGGAPAATDPRDFAIVAATQADAVGVQLQPVPADQNEKLRAAARRATDLRSKWNAELDRLVGQARGELPKAPVAVDLPRAPQPAAAATPRRQPPPPLPAPPSQAVTPPGPTRGENGLPDQPARPIPKKDGQ